MPSAGEMMSMRGMGMPRTRRGGGTRRVMMQRPVTPMLPPAAPSDKGGALVANKSPRLRPLSERMASAYDKLYKDGKPPETDPLTQAALGKLVLEIQQTNASIAGIQQGLTLQSRQKKNVSNEEKKLLKKEEDNLVSVRGAFLDIRAKFGLFAGALAIKSLMEGRPGDAAVNAGAAVASFLPEIINIVSGAVIGKTLLGGKKGGVPAPRGRMAMPRGGGKLGLGLGLLGLAGVGVGMAQGNNADAKRQELIKQDRSNPITPSDTKRFGELSNRFDAILSRMEANQSPKAKKSNRPGESTDAEGDAPRRRGGPDRSYSVRPDGSTSSPTSPVIPTRTGTRPGMSIVNSDILDFRKFRNEQFGASADRRDPPDSSGRHFDIREMGVYGANDHNINPMADDDRYDIEVHKGAGHHENRAFDIPVDNMQNGNMVAEFWRSRGYRVIFGTDPDHMEHVHVEVPRERAQEYFRIKQEQTNLETQSNNNQRTQQQQQQQQETKQDITQVSPQTQSRELFQKSSLELPTKRTGDLTIVPLPTGGEQQQQNQTLLTSTGPTPQTITIDTRYPDKTRILQKLHVNGALV